MERKSEPPACRRRQVSGTNFRERVSTTIALANLKTVAANSWLFPPSSPTRSLRVVLLLLRLLQLQRLRAEAKNLMQNAEAMQDAPRSGRMLKKTMSTRHIPLIDSIPVETINDASGSDGMQCVACVVDAKEIERVL